MLAFESPTMIRLVRRPTAPPRSESEHAAPTFMDVIRRRMLVVR
jgi:hypothetical protein